MNNNLSNMENTQWLMAALLMAAIFIFAECMPTGKTLEETEPTPSPDLVLARQKINHVVIIMQENRSFDHYFGTFPGAEGIPQDENGEFTVCLPDPTSNRCIKPFHDTHDINAGGPHDYDAAISDIDNGQMDGFVNSQQAGHIGAGACRNIDDPRCSADLKQGVSRKDAVGYHTSDEIPNYWKYAENFVLQDHMFGSNLSWSLPAHLYMLSAWSAHCDSSNPMSCQSDIDLSLRSVIRGQFSWTDLTYLLYKSGISWKYYLSEGEESDCEPSAEDCSPAPLDKDVPSIWNPLPAFTTVVQTGQLANIVKIDQFIDDATNGNLPAVCWIAPDNEVSEHPPAGIKEGQAFVTSLINAVMQGPNWNTTAIFIAWDDWGGFYDHHMPPVVDNYGYGLRVPALVVSPYAKTGYIDHQVLSFDAYVKFIEDLFLDGQRLDPQTDGRADSRPDVRENSSKLGDLIDDFDFNQAPRPPLVLETSPS